MDQHMILIPVATDNLATSV